MGSRLRTSGRNSGGRVVSLRSGAADGGFVQKIECGGALDEVPIAVAIAGSERRRAEEPHGRRAGKAVVETLERGLIVRHVHAFCWSMAEDVSESHRLVALFAFGPLPDSMYFFSAAMF